MQANIGRRFHQEISVNKGTKKLTPWSFLVPLLLLRTFVTLIWGEHLNTSVKRGMEERFQDPSHPVLKQPMEPVEAYQNRSVKLWRNLLR